ncbi:ParA family protein [Chitinophaga sp. G-6-1-13]|uniref:ParA family protein n=1 Tax=Chitinophaga fulva TaxID=2728842 RepID=A0A848GS49_9BACT|nr:ParA family protein [Chitinophaga fulva]NML40857.1 ParA family protein [Chitinophaga fulva]
MRYAFWNNKGGTGKTSLAFQTITEYAIQNPNDKILVIDLCPQANLSELLMGGLVGGGSSNLSTLYTGSPSRSIGGYFQDRFSYPFQTPQINPSSYISIPAAFNNNIPTNIDLIAGDRIVELQSNSISALSITQIPGVNTYITIIDWLNDLIAAAEGEKKYDQIFIDTNPSFAIYTQIALSASQRLIVPVMADDSSRRALTNVFSLVYGLSLPSSIYNQYAFNTKLTGENRPLPKIHLVVKNRQNQYMGPSSAYASVLSSIDTDLNSVISSNPQCFTFTNLTDGIVEVRDFQTAGVVAFAKATPFSILSTGKHTMFGVDTTVKEEYLDNCITAVKRIVAQL